MDLFYWFHIIELSDYLLNKNDRIPEDVSKENIGFDIRSSKQTEKGNIVERYIEVKAKVKIGDISLTP